MSKLFILYFLFTFKANLLSQTRCYSDLSCITKPEYYLFPFVENFENDRYLYLHSQVDLSKSMPPAATQQIDNSCIYVLGYELSSYLWCKKNHYSFIGNEIQKNKKICSPYFIFYMAKELNNTNIENTNFTLATGFNILTKYGICMHEDLCYYDDSSVKIDKSILKKATKNKLIHPEALDVRNILQIKYHLSKNRPIILGIAIDDSFFYDGYQSFKNNDLYIYNPKNSLKYYHSAICVGYDDNVSTFKVLNSMGDKWGKAGYFDIPYDRFRYIVKEAYVTYGQFDDNAKSQVYFDCKQKKINGDTINFIANEYNYIKHKNITISIGEFLYPKYKARNNPIKVTYTFDSLDVGPILYHKGDVESFYCNGYKITFLYKKRNKYGKINAMIIAKKTTFDNENRYKHIEYFNAKK